MAPDSGRRQRLRRWGRGVGAPLFLAGKLSGAAKGGGDWARRVDFSILQP